MIVYGCRILENSGGTIIVYGCRILENSGGTIIVYGGQPIKLTARDSLRRDSLRCVCAQYVSVCANPLRQPGH